eukprot:m.15565 g.15565  ORF g.15565 m.15565 type:complete len:525 (+) comp10485_c0_seq3:136-1710(+)
MNVVLFLAACLIKQEAVATLATVSWKSSQLNESIVTCEEGCMHAVGVYSNDGLSCQSQGSKNSNAVVTTQSFDMLRGGSITVVWSVLRIPSGHASSYGPSIRELGGYTSKVLFGVWNNYARLHGKRFCTILWVQGNTYFMELYQQTSQDNFYCNGETLLTSVNVTLTAERRQYLRAAHVRLELGDTYTDKSYARIHGISTSAPVNSYTIKDIDNSYYTADMEAADFTNTTHNSLSYWTRTVNMVQASSLPLQDSYFRVVAQLEIADVWDGIRVRVMHKETSINMYTRVAIGSQHPLHASNTKAIDDTECLVAAHNVMRVPSLSNVSDDNRNTLYILMNTKFVPSSATQTIYIRFEGFVSLNGMHNFLRVFAYYFDSVLENRPSCGCTLNPEQTVQLAGAAQVATVTALASDLEVFRISSTKKLEDIIQLNNDTQRRLEEELSVLRLELSRLQANMTLQLAAVNTSSSIEPRSKGQVTPLEMAMICTISGLVLIAAIIFAFKRSKAKVSASIDHGPGAQELMDCT